VQIKLGNLLDAKNNFNALSENQFLPNPYLYYAVGAKLYRHLQDIPHATQLLKSALDHADHPAEKKMLRARLSNLHTWN
jgi:predicted RNA polymerase sigma factor